MAPLPSPAFPTPLPQQWKLTLAYDGTPFAGWQVQPGLPTVQGTLAQAILRVAGEQVLPQGSGRTDRGVHALAQVASFALHAPIPPANLLRALNRALPPSIVVTEAQHAPAYFHARHSALHKTYEYRIFRGELCPPFLAPYVYACPWPLELHAMQSAAAHVLGTHAFRSFAAHDPDLTTRRSDEATTAQTEAECTTRTLHHSAFTLSPDGTILTYTVTGTGFLHHMVRNLAGTFLAVGRRHLSPDSIPTILAARDRRAAGPTAPARGLFLVQVTYPPEQDSSPIETSPTPPSRLASEP